MPLPERLGKYSIVEVLGKGAMGVVYKAFDPHIRRTVALKVIRKELIDDDQTQGLVARFKNEAQAAGRLSHPGIVSVYEYGEDEEVAYIAMEYVQGKGLREYFHRGTRFGLGDVVSIMNQLLEALAYAHEEGVIHRDIKPQNIVVEANGFLKVMDFGIARLANPPRGKGLTEAGMAVGTPDYMSPEQLAGKELDPRSDLYSTGVVLFECLTGQLPFEADTPWSLIAKHIEEDPPSARSMNAEVPETVAQVVLRAMAKEPAQRYQTAVELHDALEAIG